MTGEMIGRDGMAAIVELAKKAAMPFVAPEDQPDHVGYVVTADNEVRTVGANAYPRRYVVDSIDGFVGLVETLVERFYGDEKEDFPLVLVADSRVECILDEAGGRREAVTLPLGKTEECKQLDQLAQKHLSMPPDRFLNLLLVALHQCGVEDLALMVSNLATKMTREGGRAISQGQAGISAALQQSIQGGGQNFPEEITLNVRIHLVPEAEGLRYPVKCRLIVDAANEEKPFMMVPLAGELEKAVEKSTAALAMLLVERLDGKDGCCKVCCGRKV